jgi:inner membrane protease subunit 2
VEGDWISPAGSTKLQRIPKGACWVEGDNVGNSEDSSFFGPVPLALLQGRAVSVVWPPTRMGRVPSRLPSGRVVALAGPMLDPHRVAGDRWT